MGKLLFAVSVLALTQAWSQTPPKQADIRLRSLDGHAVEGQRLIPGWYILADGSSEFEEMVKAIYVGPDRNFDFNGLRAGKPDHFPTAPVRVLTVCEALKDRYRYNYAPVVIVGIFKSGTDETETLRQDCPTQLVTSAVGWPNSIALSGPATPPDDLTQEIEKKRAQVIASYSPAAKPRPERVVGLYGRLVSPLGFTIVPCCRASAETTIPPARLFGLDHTDLHVIR